MRFGFSLRIFVAPLFCGTTMVLADPGTHSNTSQQHSQEEVESAKVVYKPEVTNSR